jgi:hypothetical protein
MRPPAPGLTNDQQITLDVPRREPRAPTRLELSIEIAQAKRKRPEDGRKQQDIDAPDDPQNQRPKVVPAEERSEPFDGVKQWMFHGSLTRVSGETQTLNSAALTARFDGETTPVTGAMN